MAEAEWAGAKTGDGAARLKWLACGLGAVEKLQPIAERIVEDDQVLDVPFVSERAGAACDP